MVMFRSSPAEPVEALLTAHFDTIYRFAKCRVGQDEALDIAAETFAQALRSASRQDIEKDARPWLFGIANNLIRHHRRTEERRIRAYAAVPRQGSDTDGNPLEGEDIARAALVEALVRLDARDRDALLLLAWADLSYEEIAAALDVPVGTVRSRIHRARRVLRESVEASLLTGGELAIVAGEEA
jgi:RNA polymerase sigma-70 factor (ECF subfamily)